MVPPEHPTYDVFAAIDAALAEDAGDYGDISTLSTCATLLLSSGSAHVLLYAWSPPCRPWHSRQAQHLSPCLLASGSSLQPALVIHPRSIATPTANRLHRLSAPHPTSLHAGRRVPESTQARATFLAKAPGVLAGVWVAHAVFARVDPSVSVSWARKDGDRVQPGEILGEARGSAR